jgi:LAO/AO transport system kinase
VTATDPDPADAIRAGDRRALARALSLAEAGDPRAAALIARHRGALGRARRIGVTGPPGSGKSTLVAALLEDARARGLTIGVLAVDPTSPFTGGALLGDRVRMGGLALDRGVFIRSQASRGATGGVADTTADLLDLLDLGGFDLVVLETVGTGQADVDGVRATDLAVVVLSPHGGDIVQAMKAGMIEAADVVVVNKSDLGGAEGTRTDLMAAFELAARAPSDVLVCSARTREGVPAVLDALLGVPEAELAARRARKLADRLDAAVSRRLAGLRRAPAAARAFDEALGRLAGGRTSLHEAVTAVVKAALGSAREELA